MTHGLCTLYMDIGKGSEVYKLPVTNWRLPLNG